MKVNKMKESTKKLIDKEKISNEEFELISDIIKARIEEKITQSELAKKTGISQPNITRFEKNIHSASLATTIKILNALGYQLKIEKK